MDDFLKEALDIVKTQARIRPMAEDEIVNLAKRLELVIRGIAEGAVPVSEAPEPPVDSRKSIRERTVTCLECGKSFKILTHKHLAMHGLDVRQYREKWGLEKDTPLVCKGLQRERRKKMKDMKIWEKRRKTESEAE